MKKTKSEINDWGRLEYERSDLGELVLGKYVQRVAESSNIVILDPDLAKVFPNSDAVNKALRSLISSKSRKSPLAVKRKKPQTAKKRRAA